MESYNAGNMENWYIYCPGPSLKNTPMKFPDGVGIIVVNGAILWARTYAHYWALMDPEIMTLVSKRLTARALADLASRVRIWTFWGFNNMGISGDGAKWEPDVIQFSSQFDKELWHRDDNSDEVKEIHPESITPFSYHEPIPWNEFTMFTAISLAVKKGARSITIFGADMGGTGYYQANLCNFRMNHTENRWWRERVLFSYIVEACNSRGIEIIREEVK